MADLRLAAWFLWMTPLLAALSSLRDASRSSVSAAVASPDWTASLNLRIAVFSDDFTDLLRSRRFSFCLLRLIWDLMFATRGPRPCSSGSWARARTAHARSQITRRAATEPKRDPAPARPGAPARHGTMEAEIPTRLETDARALDVRPRRDHPAAHPEFLHH